MEHSAAYGVYPDAVELSQVVHALNSNGFENEYICLMLAPTHPVATIVRNANLLNQEREASSVTAGVIGWLSEFGAVVIPSVGFFIRSHVFLRALVARDAPGFCGHTGILGGLGFSDADAVRVEAQLEHTGFLVYIAALEIPTVNWALELFRRTGAEESATLEKDEADAVA